MLGVMATEHVNSGNTRQSNKLAVLSCIAQGFLVARGALYESNGRFGLGFRADAVIF